ncbi:MAG: hypothetical protein OEV87_10585 [Phycisphaerae bacterium]|nr:hypothetical protein [Phycisphaerae bacterium]
MVPLPPLGWWFDRLPLPVLVTSITFLQGYALLFWQGLLGFPGWGVSVGLELLHVWFWYRAAASIRLKRAGWGLLAVVTTGLLLAGALRELTRPLLVEVAQSEAVLQEQAHLQQEAVIIQANLTAYRDMAAGQGRRGWQEDIRRETERLLSVQQQMRALSAQLEVSARQPWINKVTQGGVVAVAVLFQVAAVLAIWSLSRGNQGRGQVHRQKTETDETPEMNPGNVSENISEFVSEPLETFRETSSPSETVIYQGIWKAVETYARKNKERLANGNGKISQASLARDLGISPPDISGIKQLALHQPVQRNPARDSVEKLAKRFGIEMSMSRP